MIHEYEYAVAVPWMIISGSILLAVGWFLWHDELSMWFLVRATAIRRWFWGVIDVVVFRTLDLVFGAESRVEHKESHVKHNEDETI